MFSSDLELGLPEEENFGFCICKSENTRKYLHERDKRSITDDDVVGSFTREISDIHLFVTRHSRIVPEARIELIFPDIDRIYMGCSALEEHLCKSSGR